VVFRLVLVVVYVSIAAVWVGSMAYSLVVVQPKVASFFPDERRREELLVVLAHGNRSKVVVLVAALLCTGLGVVITSAARKFPGYVVSMLFYAAATGIFGHVSWRHWPARVFAVPQELAGFRRRLFVQATTMLGLVGAGFVVALTVSVA
jgi:hypothetical protein